MADIFQATSLSAEDKENIGKVIDRETKPLRHRKTELEKQVNELKFKGDYRGAEKAGTLLVLVNKLLEFAEQGESLAALSEHIDDVEKKLSLLEGSQVNAQQAIRLARIVKAVQGASNEFEAKKYLDEQLENLKHNWDEIKVHLDDKTYADFMGRELEGLEPYMAGNWSWRSIHPVALKLNELQLYLENQILGLDATTEVVETHQEANLGAVILTAAASAWRVIWGATRLATRAVDKVGKNDVAKDLIQGAVREAAREAVADDRKPGLLGNIWGKVKGLWEDGNRPQYSLEQLQQREMDRVLSLIKKDGRYLGEQGGTRGTTRELKGGIDEARKMFEGIVEGGQLYGRTQDGIGEIYDLPHQAGKITFRPVSKSGPPTIDINLSIKDRNIKFKFLDEKK